MAKRVTTHDERISIVERHLKGESLPSIANDLGLNRYTTRKWWRVYKAQSWEGLFPKPCKRAKGALVKFDSIIKYVALRLKIENPGWSAELILLHMSRRRSLRGKKLPRPTALYNYLAPFLERIGKKHRYPTKRPDQKVDQVKAVHQRWQMDFKGQVTIPRSGKAVCYNICEEYSSAPLQGTIYMHPRSPLSGVCWRDIQQNLRAAFQTWGLPAQIKMDHDPLFVGSTRFEWPGALLLWLIGLGIEPIINPKAQPTKNAQVERMNRIWLTHVGMSRKAQNKEQLQQATNQAWEDRRNYLASANPHCKNKPPLIALPQLKHSGRPYSLEQEQQLFCIKRVHQYLKDWEWRRQVDQQGRISIASRQPRITKNENLFGQIVKVLFIPKTQLFKAVDLKGNYLREFNIPIISKQYLTQVGGTTPPNS